MKLANNNYISFLNEMLLSCAYCANSMFRFIFSILFE